MAFDHAKDLAASSAKLTRPTLRHIYQRPRLYRLLDKARTRPIVWVSAPAGAGKTTLIASYIASRQLPTLWYRLDQSDNDPASFFYVMSTAAKAFAPRNKRALPLLTPEYYAALPVYVGNYFDAFFARMKTSNVLVLDNYQEIGGEDAPLHAILARGFEQIPSGINVVVLSREDLPTAYARHRANDRISRLRWDEMQLTERESIGIAKSRRRHRSLSQVAFKELHRNTKGWVAGLVLLTERISEQPAASFRFDRSDIQPVFDYFANEIFSRNEDDTRDFLLKTAFWPKIDGRLARVLTGYDDSELILKRLASRNYFTTKHEDGTYEYHPLFAAFLQSRALEIYGDAEVRAIKRRIADVLARQGDVQSAAVLFEQAQDWQGLLGLVLAQAPVLAAQGRVRTIETWLNALPASVASDHPWVLYWQGACQLAFSPRRARVHFEAAFALFEKQDDATPLYLAWSGIVESFLLEYDDFGPMLPWLDRYETLAIGRKPPTADVKAAALFAYIAGLTHTRYGDPALAEHVAQAERLLQRESDLNRRFTRAVVLIFYYLWGGHGVKVKRLMEGVEAHVASPERTPLARLHWFLYKTMYAGATGALAESVRAANEGLALAETSGVRVLDFQFLGWNVWNHARAGNLASARACLRQMEAYAGRSRMMDAFRHICTAAIYLQEADFPRAIEEGHLALGFGGDSGSLLERSIPHLVLAHAYAGQGQNNLAWEHCRCARAIVDGMRSKIGTLFCYFAEADILRRQGAQKLLLEALRQLFALAREMNAVTPPWCPRADAVALCATALDADIETDYVKQIIRSTHLEPPVGFTSEKWPWRVRIFLLGRFSVFVGDTPLNSADRANKKPLQLLRAIAFHGGRNVDSRQLTDIFWPNVDRRSAEHALETLLYRLRKLLGEGCIERHKGQHTLNPRYCWLDVCAFESELDGIEGMTASLTSLRRIFLLYRGAFLEGDDSPLVVVRRERLRSKLLRVLDRCGEALEAQGDYSLAIESYQKAIEVDSLVEPFYYRLMQCYRRAGRIVDAVSLYRRCHVLFRSVLGVQPSAELSALFEELRTASNVKHR